MDDSFFTWMEDRLPRWLPKSLGGTWFTEDIKRPRLRTTNLYPAAEKIGLNALKVL